MGRISEISKEESNDVQNVKLLIGKKRSSFTSRTLDRPINKLVLLKDVENDMAIADEEYIKMYWHLQGSQMKKQYDG